MESNKNYDETDAVAVSDGLPCPPYCPEETDEKKDLFERIRKEPDLYYAWQANIAMAFIDEMITQESTIPWTEDRKDRLHKIANQAAKNFLDLLIKPTE